MRLLLCLSLLMVLLGFAGCASVNPNPPSPQANTGYVDFYCDSRGDLSWDVSRQNPKSGKMKTAFSEYKPYPGNVLRVPTPPGNHRFQVNVFNKANEGPDQVSVSVESGKVTPVKVTLKPVGSYSANEKVYGFRGSAKGYGRGTKIVSDKGDIVDIVTEAEPVQTYQSKERMAYYKASGS